MDYSKMNDYWFPLEWSDRIASKPLGVVLNSTPIVLFRTSGQIHALLDRCPHRGAPLSNGSVHNGCIVCPYHGWKFDGNGFCQSIPGIKENLNKRAHRATSFKVEERYGLIWVCLNESSTQSIPVVEYDSNAKSFRLDTKVASSLKDAAENALDPLHTHFVHNGWIRKDKTRQSINIKMNVHKDKIEAEYLNEVKQQGWIHQLVSFGRQVERSFGRFFHPSVFQIEFLSTKGEYLRINGFFSPENELSSKIFLHTSTNAPIPLVLFRSIAKPLFKIALEQDRKILEICQEHKNKYGEGREISSRGDLFGPYLSLLFTGKELPKKEYEVVLHV